MSDERFLRIQLSKNKNQVQFVLVYSTPEGETKKVYFSLPTFTVKDYVSGRSNRFFIVAKEMFSKDDPRYKDYLDQKKLKRAVDKLEGTNAPLPARTGGKI